MSEQERVNAGVQPATGAGEPTPIIFTFFITSHIFIIIINLFQ